MDEEFFRQSIALLEREGLNFWLERGTLLGFVRNGKTIPWDRDYDVGLWRHEVDVSSIVNIFNRNGFSVHLLTPYGIDGIHIHPTGGQIVGKLDLVMYTRKGSRAIHNSVILQRRRYSELIDSLERFSDPGIRADRRYKIVLEHIYHQGIYPLLPAKLKPFCRRVFVFLNIRKYRKGAVLRYEFPAHFFDRLRRVEFLGKAVNIPENAEGYLINAYGKDWRTPKKWRHWSEGATHINGKRNIAIDAG